jgi:hypothetical protein
MYSVILERSRSLDDILINHIRLFHLIFRKVNDRRRIHGTNKVREYTVIADQPLRIYWQVLGPRMGEMQRTRLHVLQVRRSIVLQYQTYGQRT